MHLPCPRDALPLLLTCALGACAQPIPQPPVAPAPPMMAPGKCDAAAAQFAVGRTIDAKLAEEVRVKSGAQRVRVVRPGQMVTMEFDAMRLTLDVDANGRLNSARCG